jgi:hypothetical protein
MARFGMVGKLLAHPGRRGELVELLLAATRELQGADGCELYVVSQDRDDLDKIWVFEAWPDERRIAPRWTCQRSLPAFRCVEDVKDDRPGRGPTVQKHVRGASDAFNSSACAEFCGQRQKAHCLRPGAAAELGLSGSRPSTGHLGDGPVAVRAVDVGLSIDQHAVGEFESRICGSFRSGSPTGQIVAEFEPACSSVC